MKRLGTHLLPIGLVAMIAVTLSAPMAHAALRSPQVAFNNAPIGSFFSGLGQTINPATDQQNLQAWTTSVSGNSTFTIMAQNTPGAPLPEIGVYNAADASPTLFPVLPSGSLSGWYATVHFGGGGLTVNLFDNNAVFQSFTSYPSGVSQSAFGFYIKTSNGTFYSQDYRNPGGNAQVLTYAGTGNTFGTWWECFEDAAYNSSTSDFDDVILNLQSVNTTPTRSQSWGGVKAGYR